LNARIPFAATLLSASLACQKPGAATAELAMATEPRAPAEGAVAQVVLLGHFERIRFPTDPTELTTAAKRRLDRAAAILNAHRTVRVVATGHAHDASTPEADHARALKRARLVDAYLESRGVRDRQVRARAPGATTPQMQERSRTAWSLDRRVAFDVTWDPTDPVDETSDADLWETALEVDLIF
jgi:outer membrane protein OmpA-like peptidoglycan-associated protein